MNKVCAVVAMLLALFSSTNHAQTALPRPSMTEAEAAQLLGAAGFRVEPGAVFDTCGELATPHISFGDINNDGRPEAMVIDENVDCHGGIDGWVGVLARDDSGSWRLLLGAAGTLRWQGSRSQGWIDALIVSAGRCPHVARFDGHRYRVDDTCAMPVAASPRPEGDADSDTGSTAGRLD